MLSVIDSSHIQCGLDNLYHYWFVFNLGHFSYYSKFYNKCKISSFKFCIEIILFVSYLQVCIGINKCCGF